MCYISNTQLAYAVRKLDTIVNVRKIPYHLSCFVIYIVLYIQLYTQYIYIIKIDN